MKLKTITNGVKNTGIKNKKILGKNENGLNSRRLKPVLLVNTVSKVAVEMKCWEYHVLDADGQDTKRDHCG